MFGLMFVIDTSTPAGNDGRTAGNVGAPAWPNDNTAVWYLLPSLWSAFEVARRGMRSKYSPPLARITVLPSPGAYARPRRGDTLLASRSIGSGSHCRS